MDFLIGHAMFLAFMVLGAVVALNATQQITDVGILPAYQAGLTAVDTFTFSNDGRVFVHLKKGVGACNVTVKARASVRGKAVPDQVLVLAANSELMIGPFPPDLYSDASGLVSLLFSEVTGLTAAVVRL